MRRQTPQAVFALGLLLAAAAAGGCQDAPSPLDPITPQALLAALHKAKQPWPDNTGVNDRLRQRR